MIKITKNTTRILGEFLTLIILLSSCEKGIYGTGEIQNFTSDVTPFDAISLSLTANVSITKSTQNELSIWAQDNIMDNMEIFVSNRTLYIKFDERVSRHKPINIEIYSPEIEQLTMSGANHIDVLSPFENDRLIIHSSGVNHFNFADSMYCNEMEYHASGTSYLSMPYLDVKQTLNISTSGVSQSRINTLNCDKLKFTASGTASPLFNGTCETQEINTSGSLHYSGLKFHSKQCSLDVSGTANLDLFVEDHLQLDVSGSAKIYYKGQPHIDKQSDANTTLIKAK